MFFIKVTNKYGNSVIFDSDKEIKSGQTFTSDRTKGTHTLDIPALGNVVFFDLADKELHGYENALKEKWGVLIRYRGDDVYYRYEGDGEMNLTVDEHGCVQVTKVKGSSLQVDLRDLRAPGHSVAPDFHEPENGDGS